MRSNCESPSGTLEEVVMDALAHERRSFLFGLGALGFSQVLPQGTTQAAAPQGYVLGATEGEHLVHFRDHGNIFIKIGSATGSNNVGLGTQQVTLGAGIPVHRHLHMDEAFYVLEGSGLFTLTMRITLLRKARRYSSPETPGMGLRIPTTNCSCCGLCHLVV